MTESTPDTVQAATTKKLATKEGFGLAPPPVGPLRSRFGCPPFTDINTRNKDWQKRRRLWLSLGIRSEEGREGKLTFSIPDKLKDGSVGARTSSQTSIFDPMLCELAYGWWCPPGGVIGDPFAGGSVRGIVASVMGFKYCGIELRAEQVEANRLQAAPGTQCVGEYPPRWKCGDSDVEAAGLPELDFIFSCPPYGDLEVYSDDARDISNMTYEQFLVVYTRIIAKTMARLKDNRFACFVVSNFRDKKDGWLRRFDNDTANAFEAAGGRLWTYARIINSVGTAAMRTNGTFVRGNRKLVNTTQDMLVFCKGDPAAAAALIPADAGITATAETTPTEE